MNILFVITYFHRRGQPVASGFLTYVHRITQVLLSLGHKPIILACGKKNDRWVENGVEVIQIKGKYSKFPNKNVAGIVNCLKKSYNLNQEIKRLQSEMKIDIIQFDSTGGIALLYYGKIPAVMRLSLYSKDYRFADEISSPKYLMAMAWLESCASRRCNAVFAPSKVIADAFSQDAKRKVYVIETPYVDDVINYDDYYVNKYLQGKKFVLFFGLLAMRKGILVIEKCLERFLEKNKEYFFVFIGKSFSYNGETAIKRIKKSAGAYKDRVIIWPAISQKQLYPVIQKADFIVLPSLRDNLPNACIEAMYFGKVVIGTNGASFEQLIEHEVSGLLCRVGDSDDLLEKMQTAVWLNEEQKMQIGRNAKKRVEQLRPEVVGKRLLSFYSHVIEAAKKDE